MFLIRTKRAIRRPESEWFRVENTHEAIISKDVFNQVQKQIASRRRPMKSGKTQIFAGHVKCADCGWSMSYAKRKYKTCSTGFFNCSQFRKLGKVGRRCSAHYIRYDTLYAYVLARLQEWICQAHTDEKQLLSKLLKSSDKEAAKAYKKQSAELAKAEKRKAEVDRLFVKLYEDNVSTKLSDRRFAMMSEQYEDEQAMLKSEIISLQAEIAEQEWQTENLELFIKKARKYEGLKEQTPYALRELVKAIYVEIPDKSSSKKNGRFCNR